LIIISHDRDFLQGLSNKIYEFKNQNIREFLGDVNTFLKNKELENLDDLNLGQVAKKKSNQKLDSVQKISYHQRKERDRNIRKLEKKISKIENEITQLELEQKEFDLKLSDPIQFQEISKQKDFFKNYEAAKLKIKEKEKLWEVLVEELNELKKI
jgi:ATP-binding cassette subfamily F protein 3